MGGEGHKGYIHCRNCPVYARAGAALLNRPVPADYRREWTAHFAQPKPRAAVPNTSATIFTLGPEWLALDTTLIQEIAERRPMHSLPGSRSGNRVVLGLVNVRGELLVCVSLGRLLGISQGLGIRGQRSGVRGQRSAVRVQEELLRMGHHAAEHFAYFGTG